MFHKFLLMRGHDHPFARVIVLPDGSLLHIASHEVINASLITRATASSNLESIELLLESLLESSVLANRIDLLLDDVMSNCHLARFIGAEGQEVWVGSIFL